MLVGKGTLLFFLRMHIDGALLHAKGDRGVRWSDRCDDRGLNFEEEARLAAERAASLVRPRRDWAAVAKFPDIGIMVVRGSGGHGTVSM